MLASLTVGAAFALTMPVTTILAQPAGSKVSVWSGVYTQAQSKRGETLYSGACAQCHGLKLNGAGQPDLPPSPAIARATFLRKWDGKTVAELLTYVRETMPIDTPGTLTDQQTEDVGLALMKLEETVRDIAAKFGIAPEDLNLDLGPVGKLI